MTADLTASPFLAACRGERPSRRPVWFQRQAGRSLPEYRAIRGTGSILQAVRDPALATEITLQPIRRYDTDAAILYSDIMVPIAATGFGVDIKAGIGPVAEQPFRSRADLDHRLGVPQTHPLNDRGCEPGRAGRDRTRSEWLLDESCEELGAISHNPAFSHGG